MSFIGYRDGPSPVAGPGKVITCCSDRSVYDPSAGARVVAGPAPQPLATILLEHDAATDELVATGTFGGEMFERVLPEVRLPPAARDGRPREARWTGGRVRELRLQPMGAVLKRKLDGDSLGRERRKWVA